MQLTLETFLIPFRQKAENKFRHLDGKCCRAFIVEFHGWTFKLANGEEVWLGDKPNERECISYFPSECDKWVKGWKLTGFMSNFWKSKNTKVKLINSLKSYRKLDCHCSSTLVLWRMNSTSLKLDFKLFQIGKTFFLSWTWQRLLLVQACNKEKEITISSENILRTTLQWVTSICKR